jgi:hypothetical protein
VLALPPAGADAKLDAAAGDVVGGDDRLRQHGGVAEGLRGDHRPQAQPRGDRGQRGDRRPGVERAALAPVVDDERRLDLAVRDARPRSSAPPADRATVAAMAQPRRIALFRPRPPSASATGAQARGALAIGALAVGAAAIGGFAIGRLAVGRLAIGRAKIGKLSVEELEVGRLTVRDDQP